jgi:VIT1/CCC1 family predicted Fe2+/Mn2+ transporter
MGKRYLLPEHHLVSRIGWLRAGVLGANDGIASTASLIIGVAAAAARPADILLAGAAGLVAGAMSMAIVIFASGALLVSLAIASLLFLGLLGAIGARAGGALVWKATARVTFWGALEMALTAGIGKLVGTAI